MPWEYLYPTNRLSRSIKCIHNWTYFAFISSESLIAITDCKEKTCLPWPQNSLLTRSYFKSKLKNDSDHCFCSVALFLYNHKPLCFCLQRINSFHNTKIHSRIQLSSNHLVAISMVWRNIYIDLIKINCEFLSFTTKLSRYLNFHNEFKFIFMNAFYYVLPFEFYWRKSF